MQRRRPLRSTNTNANITTSTERHDKDASALCWHAVSGLLDQENESVQSILVNFGIVGALLLSMLIGLIMTIPLGECAWRYPEFVAFQPSLPLSFCVIGHYLYS